MFDFFKNLDVNHGLLVLTFVSFIVPIIIDVIHDIVNVIIKWVDYRRKVKKDILDHKQAAIENAMRNLNVFKNSDEVINIGPLNIALLEAFPYVSGQTCELIEKYFEDKSYSFSSEALMKLAFAFKQEIEGINRCRRQSDSILSRLIRKTSELSSKCKRRQS